MTERKIDLGAAATLFAGSDLDRQIARMPSVDRAHRYFDVAGDAITTACESLGFQRQGAFLVQNSTRFDMVAMTALYAAATRRAQA